MMGRSHLMLGAAGFLAFEAAFPNAFSFISPPLDTAQLAAGTLVAAGAAMLPDLDHPEATLAHSLPPVSNVVARFVNIAAGGHRKGTHTIWAWLGVTALAWFALMTLSNGPIIGLIFAIFCALLMLQVLTQANGLICLILAAILGGAAVLATGNDFGWMVQAIFLGYFLHLVGDIVTTEGIPPFFPLPPNIAVPVIGSTDHWREKGTGIACGFIAFYLIVTTVFIPGWNAETDRRAALIRQERHVKVVKKVDAVKPNSTKKQAK